MNRAFILPPNTIEGLTESLLYIMDEGGMGIAIVYIPEDFCKYNGEMDCWDTCPVDDVPDAIKDSWIEIVHAE